jgi:hypothetical protein
MVACGSGLGTRVAESTKVGAGGGPVPPPAAAGARVVIDTVPALPAAHAGVRVANSLRPVAAVQGAYYFLTGVWPLLDLDSFQAVTGPKADLWLVYSVGSLVAVIGATLVWAAASGRIASEIAALAIGSALVLGMIDVIFVARGVISWVYLIDAAGQAAVIGWWMLAYFGTPRLRQAATPQYPHVHALLNRGVTVSSNGPQGK